VAEAAVGDSGACGLAEPRRGWRGMMGVSCHRQRRECVTSDAMADTRGGTQLSRNAVMVQRFLVMVVSKARELGGRRPLGRFIEGGQGAHLVSGDTHVLKNKGTVVEKQVVGVRVEGGGQRGVEGCVGGSSKGGADVDVRLGDCPLAQGGAQEAHVGDLVLQWDASAKGGVSDNNRMEYGCKRRVEAACSDEVLFEVHWECDQCIVKVDPSQQRDGGTDQGDLLGVGLSGW
jgi:hypothetical protein